MDLITALGPGSDLFPNNTVEGYQPVSRNGEVTQNAFVDGFLWNQIVDVGARKKKTEYDTMRFDQRLLGDEEKPQFHEWASVQPGFICVIEKTRSRRYRNHVSAETAAPVLACAQLLSDVNNMAFMFAGVARSKSVRDWDDIANGAKRDEFFTLHIGGPVTVLNNGSDEILAGDPVEWTFSDERETVSKPKRQKVGPRRIQIRSAVDSHARVFGRALSYAKRGEPLDVLVGHASM